MKEFHQGSCFMSWMKRKQWLRETSAYETEYTVTVCWSHVFIHQPLDRVLLNFIRFEGFCVGWKLKQEVGTTQNYHFFFDVASKFAVKGRENTILFTDIKDK